MSQSTKWVPMDHWTTGKPLRRKEKKKKKKKKGSGPYL
jgi:hypothetical protein